MTDTNCIPAMTTLKESKCIESISLNALSKCTIFIYLSSQFDEPALLGVWFGTSIVIFHLKVGDGTRSRNYENSFL